MSASGVKPAIDPETIACLRELDDPQFLRELIETFMVDAQERLAAMTVALAGEDPRTFAKVAHAFKGAAGAIGALPLAALAEKMQHVTSAGQLDEAEALLCACQQEYDRVEPALREVMRSLESAQAA